VFTLRANSGGYSVKESLERRADNDSHDRRRTAGVKPGRASVNRSEQSSQEKSSTILVIAMPQDSGLAFAPVLRLFTTAGQIPLNSGAVEKTKVYAQ